jgi:magnesium transporter
MAEPETQAPQHPARPESSGRPESSATPEASVKPSRRFMVDASGTAGDTSDAAIRPRVESGGFFWLDVVRPDADDLTLLRDVFAIHPLALEDAEHFGQRPKIDDFQDHVQLVVFGSVLDGDGLVEVHCLMSESYLVTLHTDDCPAFTDLMGRVASGRLAVSSAVLTLYEIIDALVDSFFPLLASLDDRLDSLEDGVVAGPNDEQLQEILRLKRLLVGVRKAIGPQRDLLARMVNGVAHVPGMTPEITHYYRDAYDHMIRIFDLVDTYRDLLGGAMDVYLSTVSNRLNAVMKKLTIIATFFMPLTWVTGFFGMNFGYLVRGVTSAWAFLILGLASQAAIIGGLYWYLRRRDWL